MLPRPSVSALLAATLVLVGCKDREIVSYKAPKDPPPAMPGAAGMPASTNAGGSDMASTAVPTGSNDVTWQAPSHWTEKPTSAMRKGSYAVKGDKGGEADLSITAFPGNTGGLGANLNRWRSQLGLPPLSEAELNRAIEHVDVNDLHLEFVDFVGTAKGEATRTIGAVLARPEETWFFKLMGPDAVVAAEKPAFREFLKTVKARQP